MRNIRAPKAWVVAVDMGYGHERAAFALRRVALGKEILTANHYPGIPASDRRIWEEIRLLYETISRFKRVPVLGDLVFSVFNRFQTIKEFYPKDQGIEPPTLQLRQIYQLMERRNWGKHLILKLNQEPFPMLHTFFASAFMAEHWGYQGEIYLVVTDSDVSRTWAPLIPAKTKIRYLVPTLRAKERLRSYRVPERNIFLTGFPLPEELTRKAKEKLKRRLIVLDPKRNYIKRYAGIVKQYVGVFPRESKRIPVVTVTFAVGGAGAQLSIGEKILESIAPLLQEKKMRFNLLLGLHKDMARHFLLIAKEQNLSRAIGKELRIIVAKNRLEYFKTCNDVFSQTDVLWTKPSELIFYAGLGLPILIAPPVGSQEVQNRKWLRDVGAGIDQLNPKFTSQWLPDLLSQGAFAEAAMQGFVEIEKRGAGNIIELVKSQ